MSISHLNGPAQEVVDATSRVLAAADRVSDPVERALALEQANANIAHLQAEIRRGRAAAIRAAISERTATSVAAELGISRSRLYKILEE